MREIVKFITLTVKALAISGLVVLTIQANTPKSVDIVHPPTLAETYMSSEGCWNGGTGHPLPTAAVVESVNGTEYLTSPKAVGDAINQAISGKGKFVRIYGFCA